MRWRGLSFAPVVHCQWASASVIGRNRVPACGDPAPSPAKRSSVSHRACLRNRFLVDHLVFQLAPTSPGGTFSRMDLCRNERPAAGVQVFVSDGTTTRVRRPLPPMAQPARPYSLGWLPDPVDDPPLIAAFLDHHNDFGDIRKLYSRDPFHTTLPGISKGLHVSSGLGGHDDCSSHDTCRTISRASMSIIAVHTPCRRHRMPWAGRAARFDPPWCRRCAGSEFRPHIQCLPSQRMRP